jgi:ubiquinone/menaquinone biosynthesis C-methylase UbiE
MTTHDGITAHYTPDDALARIRAGLESLGKSPGRVGIADLGPVDEFHIGGRPATADLGERMGLTRDQRLLDIGCGLGGSARFFAETFGCPTVGIDLTPAYVELARELTAWTGLSARASFEVGSATDMPFTDASFDAAVLIHVGMNIADKRALFAETARVLAPGARFGLYDVLRTGPGEIGYPVPWASTPENSFLADLETYTEALEAAGFELIGVRERQAFALEFFAAMRERAAGAGAPPPLGLHILMGRNTPEKIENIVAALSAGSIAPVEMILEKRRV